MRLLVGHLNRRLLPLLWPCLGSLALAHEGDFQVTNLQIIEKKGERFLGMRVAYREHDAPLSFSAVLIDAEEAILEARRGSSYQPAERLVIEPGVHVFSAESPRRVRLPDELKPPRVSRELTATLLFDPGFLVSLQVLVPGAGTTRRWTWQVGLLLGSLVMIGASAWLITKRRMSVADYQDTI